MVLTDIGGDPDDQQSLVRLMVYANEFEIEGLMATASGTPGELKREISAADLIQQIVRAYGQVLPNLKRHAPRWPEPGLLWAESNRGTRSAVSLTSARATILKALACSSNASTPPLPNIHSISQFGAGKPISPRLFGG